MTTLHEISMEELLAETRERVNAKVEENRESFELRWQLLSVVMHDQDSDIILALLARALDVLAELGVHPGLAIALLGARCTSQIKVQVIPLEKPAPPKF